MELLLAVEATATLNGCLHALSHPLIVDDSTKRRPL
jgi:hypothetical protein